MPVTVSTYLKALKTLEEFDGRDYATFTKKEKAAFNTAMLLVKRYLKENKII